MKWVTREKPHIDRIACAWAIKKFVDLEAKCSFESLIEKYKLYKFEQISFKKVIQEGNKYEMY